MSGAEDRDDFDNTTSVREFHASLRSFAFIKSQARLGTSPNLQRTDGAQNVGRKRPLSSDEPDVEVYFKPPTSHSPFPNPTKKKKWRGYAAPETYAHLRVLQDVLTEGLDVVFCGINPGQKSAEIGHHFGHPTNHFWSCLHEAGFTPTRLPPEEDHTLPERFSLGLTNLVDRATAEQNELSVREQAASVPALLDKIMRYRPRVVCFIGLGIAKIVQAQLSLETSNKKNKKIAQSKEGLQAYKVVYPDCKPDNVCETLFYAVPCTSGRVVHFQKSKKVELFSNLKLLVEQLKCSQLNTENIHAVAL